MTDPDPIMGAHVSDWSSEDSIEGPFDRSPAWGTWISTTRATDLDRAIREATDEEIEDALAAQTLMENDQ